jgi:hypothetical protein
MNPNPAASPDEPEAPVPNYNAEAIEEARRRVQARDREAARNAAGYRRQNRPWGLGYGTGMNEDMLGVRMIFFALLAGAGLLISALVWLGENLRWPTYFLVQGLDAVTGASALPMAPWLAWTFWGAIFGGALGYWLVSPLYGERGNRSMILWLPLLAMATIALLVWCFTAA